MNDADQCARAFITMESLVNNITASTIPVPREDLELLLRHHEAIQALVSMRSAPRQVFDPETPPRALSQEPSPPHTPPAQIIRQLRLDDLDEQWAEYGRDMVRSPGSLARSVPYYNPFTEPYVGEVGAIEEMEGTPPPIVFSCNEVIDLTYDTDDTNDSYYDNE